MTAPVQLQIAPFDSDGNLGDFFTIDSWTPSGDILDWADAHELTGEYTATEDGSVQVRLYIDPVASSGVFHFDDGTAAQTTGITYDMIPGLSGALTTLSGQWQSLADAIASTVSGVPIIGAELSDVVEALGNFNPANILGSLGSSDLPGDVSGIIGHIIDAFKGQPAGTTTSASLADLYNTVNQTINNTAGEDETTFYDTTINVPISSWANQIDIVVVGKGQDGENGITIEIDGQGGQPGKVNMVTLLKGTHYDSGTPYVTVTINSDGSVTSGVPAGTATTAHTITGAIGSGTQSPKFGTGYMGIGPGPINYNSKPYAGGGNQNTGGANGLGPGGGGAGGVGPVLPAGGKGAPGGAWVRELATVITGASTGADVTPPSVPTITFDGATNTSITMTPSGSVDA